MSSSRPTPSGDDRGSPAAGEVSPVELLRDQEDATARLTDAACCGATGCRETDTFYRIEIGDTARILCPAHATEYARRQQ